ncbi:MAG: type II toxin-antitoxin system VapC family toxin [Gemmatimonadota bacterium]
MVVYAESSAVLRWLFSEPGANAVIQALEQAPLVVTSELTGIECARAIHRARATGLVSESAAAVLSQDYASAAGQWDHLAIGERVTHLAAAPWPVEPVRALDAIHLGSVLVAREAWPELKVLTFDDRVRANAAALGLALARIT